MTSELTQNQSPPTLAPSPRTLLLAAALALAAIGLTRDAWLDIYRLGTVDEELSYVLVAPLIIGLLAWIRRDQLPACRLRGGWVGLLIMAAAWGFYWYGYLGDPVIWRGAAVMLAVGAFVAAAGSDVLLRFWPAFATTIFLVPVSPYGRYRIAVPLQNATALVTQTVCDVLGIHVDRFGAMLSINGVEVAVAEACNGMRMVMTLFLVCFVVAFAVPLRPVVRILFLLATPAVAIAANVLRLVPTVWMFGHVSTDGAEMFHTASGWVMTALSFFLLIGIFRALEWAGIPVMQAKQIKHEDAKDRRGLAATKAD